LLSQTGRKVLLFSPPYQGKVFGPPLGLLSLAASIRQEGFNPVIVDGAITPSFLQVIAKEVSDSFAFGISVLTGPMIRDAIDASHVVRRVRPDLPIIYGGWHPTLLSKQTLQESFVDIVVRHQGEKTLVDVLKRQATGASLDLVAGCWFKRNGKIIINEDRPSSPLSSIPGPAYDLVDFEAYAGATGGRKLPYATSIGCPYACNYCTDMVFYNRRFNPQTVEGVVDEIVDLAKTFALDEIALVDSNFLVNTRRAIGIARGLLKSGIRLRWTFQASTDLLCRLSGEEVEVLAASGVSHIGFGTESASPEILRKMHKAHQTIDDMFEAARKCRDAGIRVTYNLIFGYPGEEDSHRRETLRVMSQIAEQFDNVTFSPNLFTPYPGIPIWPELIEAGLQEPQTFEGWASMGLGQTKLPWLDEKASAMLSRSMSYFLLANQLTKAKRTLRSSLARRGVRALQKPLHWRLKHHAFSLPVELWASMAQQWLVVRRSLLNGEPLGREMKEVQ
jgi:anaerobic magnesium-protoporphyrin IX monomethyl ester cyclase